MKGINIDIHTNIGLFPKGKPTSKEHYCSVDEMVEYLTKHKITAHVCMYPYSEYHLIEELVDRLPNIMHFGIQCLMGKNEEHANDIKNLQFDTDKIHCYGIKLASHRGFWIRDGVVVNGLDYGIYARDIQKYILAKLPDNSITYWHLQGDPKICNGSTSTQIVRFAAKYSNLKYILAHCGDYCQANLSEKPKNVYESAGTLCNTFRYGHSKALITSCISYADEMPNVWIDTSIYSPNKQPLMNSNSWCVGSDFPFGSNQSIEVKKFNNLLGVDKVEEQMDKTLIWLQS